MTREARDSIRVKNGSVYHKSAGGYVLSEEQGRVYVALLKDRDGKYFIPKGHLKTDESPERAALREIKEELCLTITPVKVANVSTIKYGFHKDNDPRDHFKELHIYVFKLPGKPEIRPSKSENYVEAGWSEVKQAIQILEYEKDTLQEALKLFEGYKILFEHLKTIISYLKQYLKTNLIAIVDSGSISSGGYVPGWSDIDLLIVLRKLDLTSKLEVAACVNRLKNELEINIGLNVISLNEFESPNFPEIRLSGKTLQALVEYALQPERLLYPKKNIKAFVPNKKQVKFFSLSNISYLVLQNRRELTNISVLDSVKFKTIVEKQIRYAFIIMKLALQYHENVVCETKQDTLVAAKLYFKNFDFGPIGKALAKTKKWNLVKHQGELKQILEDANNFIENFSTYIFSR